MHAQVHDWLAWRTRDLPPAGALRILEVGSLDINGSARRHFPGARRYHGIDLVSGPGVDEVADAATWHPPHPYDVVVCCEVFEHAERWRDILQMMWQALDTGGTLLATCAGPGRAPHSAVDGMALRPGEHYANLSVAELNEATRDWAVAGSGIEWAAARGDLYLWAERPTSSPGTTPPEHGPAG